MSNFNMLEAKSSLSRLVEARAAWNARSLSLAMDRRRQRAQFEEPLAFISHDSRDKDSLVRDLAKELSKLMCPVWYDEYSLRVGDSLRATIETGLKETKKCVLVLSPNFLSNEGWGKVEFDSVFTREILEQTNVILPVWHNVHVNDVYNYSPRLADKVASTHPLGSRNSRENCPTR